MLSEDGLYLKWWLDDNGGLDAFKGAVELKTDIQGLDDSMVEGKYSYSWCKIKQIKN